MENALIIAGTIIGVLLLVILIAAICNRGKRLEKTPEDYVNASVDAMLDCLWDDVNYRGFKTRSEIGDWIKAQRNRVQAKVNHE